MVDLFLVMKSTDALVTRFNPAELAGAEACPYWASAISVATGRLKHSERMPDAPRGRIPKNATDKERMARRLRTKVGRRDYARRKAIVEPVFGQVKVKQHTGHLRLRGLEGASGEWTLHALCHHLRKLAKSYAKGAMALA